MIKCRTALTALLLLGCIGWTQTTLAAAPPLQDTNVITFPSDSATVSGVVEIIGTVTHPNFDSYGVLYAPGPAPTGESQWVSIVFGVEDQVTGGSLALWDTTVLNEAEQPVVPNGTYTLALARYRDGRTEPDLYYVRNITVNNQDLTPTAAPTDTPLPLPTAVAETPTPVPVELPPTATESSAATEQPDEEPTPPPTQGDEAEATDEASQSPIDLGQLRSHFLRGARTTLWLFGIWGLYVLGKIGVRYFLRTREFGPPNN